MLRIGMVGLDTSHAVEFTKLFRDETLKQELAGARIVAAYPAGSDLPLSRDRVKGFTDQVAALGVRIVDSLNTLIQCVDVVMLESVDGSVHLQQAIPILDARKPLFIDKPLAHSVADMKKIEACSLANSVPCFSASSLRFSPDVASALNDVDLGTILGASTWGPCHLPEGFPDFYFYGIHGIEVLFQIMGSDCENVSCIRSEDTDLVRAQWASGRVGTYRGIRNGSLEFGATLFGSNQNRSVRIPVPYRELCIAIARFFHSGIAPVSLSETIKIYEFMDAANRSHRQSGDAVRL